MDRVERAIPWLLGAILAARSSAALADSPLLAGDLPGHLEAIRWSARHLWPAPWGWDPRYLLGAPIGILYPPLLTWLGGGLAILVGAEAALRTILILAVATTPPALAFAARGLGLRPRSSALAASLATAVLCLPGPGLGGTFRQTFVAGNAANALALPLFLVFVGSVRRGLARPGRWRAPAATLAAVLLSHFLMGAAAAGILAAYALVPGSPSRVRRLARGIGIGAVALLLAAPFLLPFAVHFREGSPDGLSYAPLPSPAEWLVLALVSAAALAGGRAARRGLLPGLALLLLLYVVRGLLLPRLGELPFRMEWHRFRLLLYLGAAPAGAFVLERLRLSARASRGVVTGAALGTGFLLLAVPYPERGPAPVPAPRVDRSGLGARTLVLASPEAQHGSWHGLQLRLPEILGVSGAKGLFVEASPFARPVFEIERAVSGPDARPRWWGIRVASTEDLNAREIAERLAVLGIESILAREPVSSEVEALARSVEPLPDGFRLLRFSDLPLPAGFSGSDVAPVPGAPVPARASAGVRIAAAPSGNRLEIDFGDRAEGRCLLHVFAHSDWRIESGEGRIVRLSAGPGRRPVLVGIAGRGRVTLRFAPRIEEWGGLALGAAGIALLGVSFRRGGGRHGSSRSPESRLSGSAPRRGPRLGLDASRVLRARDRSSPLGRRARGLVRGRPRPDGVPAGARPA